MKPRSLLLIIPFCAFLILLLSDPSSAQESYSIVINRTFSTFTGAENLLAAHRLAYTFENKLLQPTWFDENNVAGKTLGISYRLGKTILLDNIFDSFVGLLQHEVYGHGARAREYELSDIKYSLSLTFPYGLGTGMTSYQYPIDKPFSPDQELSFTIAGVEANTLLSKRLALRWLRVMQSIIVKHCSIQGIQTT